MFSSTSKSSKVSFWRWQVTKYSTCFSCIVSSKGVTLADKVVQFESLLITVSSSCIQHLSFNLPHAIGVFNFKFKRAVSSSVQCESVMWLFSRLELSMERFTATREEDMSSRTTLHSFSHAKLDTPSNELFVCFSHKLLNLPQQFGGNVLCHGFITTHENNAQAIQSPS